MSLETANYIAGLAATNPLPADPKSQGDDHLRLIKAVLQRSFAGFPGMVIVTGVEAQGATGNDYAVSVSPAPAAYTDNMLVIFKATHASTGGCTLAINGLPPAALLSVEGQPLQAGDIGASTFVVAAYNGAVFLLLSGNDRACRNGEDYHGAHDFAAASVTVATAAPATNSPAVASTAYADRAVAAEAALRAAADALLAPKDSPVFTGTPTGPTPATNDNSARLATTAFVVQAVLSGTLPGQISDGVMRVLTSLNGAVGWGLPQPDLPLFNMGIC